MFLKKLRVNDMKNVIGLEKYREYQKQIYELKKRVAKNRSENDETSIKDAQLADFNYPFSLSASLSLQFFFPKIFILGM